MLSTYIRVDVTHKLKNYITVNKSCDSSVKDSIELCGDHVITVRE